jgi:hypothetical protein
LQIDYCKLQIGPRASTVFNLKFAIINLQFAIPHENLRLLLPLTFVRANLAMQADGRGPFFVPLAFRLLTPSS